MDLLSWQIDIKNLVLMDTSYESNTSNSNRPTELDFGCGT
jgi:hypothetical protein